ncbi:hypothetical protein WBJ53_26460 [Spirosoma sp. SC4-14]
MPEQDVEISGLCYFSDKDPAYETFFSVCWPAMGCGGHNTSSNV